MDDLDSKLRAARRLIDAERGLRIRNENEVRRLRLELERAHRNIGVLHMRLRSLEKPDADAA